MSGSSSLKILSKAFNIQNSGSNIGIGGSSINSNVKLTITNDLYSWKNTIFKNISNNDYISIGLYDLNSNNNCYIASIDSNDNFKDLYINNLGIASQPSSLIGNVIINGKTTLGNYNNFNDNNYILNVYSINSNNLATFGNSNSSLSFYISSNSNFNINTSTNKLFINGNSILNGNIIISNDINNDFINSNNYSLYILSNLFIGQNGNLLRLASSNINNYYSQISTNDTNIYNSNNTKIKLISPINQNLLSNINNYDISGSIYYYITGSNPIHSFNYESNGINTSLMVLNNKGTLFINSNNKPVNNNEKLIISGNVSIFNSNSSNPARVIIGESSTNNSILQTFGSILIGASNSESSLYSLYVNSNVKINSNLIIGSNLNINGVISGNGSNISNLKISSLYLDNSNLKLNANFIKINSNSGLNTNSNNELIINFDSSKFIINSNIVSLNNINNTTYWNSAISNIIDPLNVSRIFFNNSDSYVGILNNNPKSYLFVGQNGNLLRLASSNINDSYYSQIATNDYNISNSNNTKIKLIFPFNQQYVSSNSSDIAGSIYYYITGSNNPIHSFNYESNGINTPLMVLNNTGTLFINSNNRPINNNEKLIVSGNVSILNSNSSNPARVIIGESSTNNSILQTFGSVIVGTSNLETSLYSLYVNSNVKINSNLIIGSNLNINGVISGNGSNISNLKISSLYLDNSNLKLNANFIKINNNSGLTTNINNELLLNFDTSTFFINNNNQLALSNIIINTSNITSNISSSSNSSNFSYWNSANTNITNPLNVSRIFFNNSDSYVGILNNNPRSYLFVGQNGNLLRLASSNINDSYYSQISTNDYNISNSNNTKIKLIFPFNQQNVSSSNSFEIAGSIYYYITGSNNPIHSFNYENNGINTPLMVLNNTGTLFINSNRPINNNEKLIVSGNVSILNSNSSNPSRVIIGESSTNNSILQTFGSVIVGTSNLETSLYSLYVNSNVKINSNLVISGNLITSNQANFLNTVSMGNIQSSTELLNDSSYILKVSGKIGLNGTISTISDERLKINVKTYENALDKILNCRGVSYNYNQNFYNNEEDYKKTNIGVIAQEIEKIIPELVDKNDNGYKNVNYIGIIGILIEAIKELNNKLENKLSMI